MSWDVLLLRLPDDVSSMDELPDDYSPEPLGWQCDVLTAVTRTVPDVDLSDPAWGVLSGPTWSIELNIGSEDPLDSVMLHIRGSGDDVLTPVLRLAEALRCKALDLSEGDLITPGQTSGWHAFQQFRDRCDRTVSVIPAGHRAGIGPLRPVGFSTLRLSVAAPPADGHEALLTAAEHFAFCPDNIRQGSRPYTLAAYAERITGAHRWDFWWD